ncbi:alpha-1,2-fucosyltransferase [Ovoidimarina sediminis]|uniref:alpha-1,2-fucosyltransferase n=1 Tax=Ovoidimarina sediminis TaxID=3079856 RepID=UPI0029063CE3|nr:alpha-1,2-fucosyltransferase [Rhodophyticola sp. MJ-SS7]MDU8945825.1 alpha-1,2-fucosyltransferase [Rhodophyticola sp. MJ-SS7]
MGNQLFEYAAARGLAARLGVEVSVDERMLARMNDAPARPHFAWRVVEPERLPPFRWDRPTAYFLWRYLGLSPKIRRERGHHPNFLTWPDDSYLHGYWQHEGYFAHIADELRRECRVTTPPSAANQKFAARITGCLSASLHVRRGDFLDVAPDAVCTEHYYRTALDRLAAEIGEMPTVFVFSDDPDWARGNLNLPAETVVVDINGPDSAHEDLRLMVACRHNIISNSTFSWWGAWLGTPDNRVVIGPKTETETISSWLADGWISVLNQ